VAPAPKSIRPASFVRWNARSILFQRYCFQFACCLQKLDGIEGMGVGGNAKNFEVDSAISLHRCSFPGTAPSDRGRVLDDPWCPPLVGCHGQSWFSSDGQRSKGPDAATRCGGSAVLVLFYLCGITNSLATGNYPAATGNRSKQPVRACSFLIRSRTIWWLSQGGEFDVVALESPRKPGGSLRYPGRVWR